MSKKAGKKPDKRRTLLTDVRTCLDAGWYLDTFHSSEQVAARSITRAEVETVLRQGNTQQIAIDSRSATPSGVT